MKKIVTLLLSCLLLYFSFSYIDSFAEDLPSGNTIPKLEKTSDDPVLSNGKVYPFWGPVCQRYTYSVVYFDKQGRSPEYVKIYFNGKMLDMQKEDSNNNDYQNGVKYVYKNVPDKFGSNFYYFEASNGLGKARDSIIDSPDNGPVLFDSDFKNNEIVLIDGSTGKEVWRYSTGEEWVGGVMLSDDGKYLAAQSSNHIYLFDTATQEPLWSYLSTVKGVIGGDVKGGVAISADGQKIFAALHSKALMFDKSSSKPLWEYNIGDNGGSAYGVDISKDGQYAAVAMAGSETDTNSNVLIMFNLEGDKLWQYHSSGNWHEVNLSFDGSYVAGATGCPDRRGYLFSKDSNEPIIKSDPLSVESPVDEASIDADGNLIAYGVESGYGAVVLMEAASKNILWTYQTPQASSVRALSMTPDGSTIGAGTMRGDILIFGKDSNIPIEKNKINSAIGAFDIVDDGSFYATGSADKTVRIFERNSNLKAEVVLNEYIGELDISANGRYVAAGTSGSVYFFESLMDLSNIASSSCDQIIEPPEEDTSLFGGQNGMDALDTGEDSKAPGNTPSLPVIVSFGFVGILGVSIVSYVFICRKRKLNCNKKILIVLGLFLIIILGIAIYFWQIKDTEIEKVGNKVEEVGEAEEVDKKGNSGDSTCGDGLCEPDLGETQQNCSSDCSGSGE